MKSNSNKRSYFPFYCFWIVVSLFLLLSVSMLLQIALAQDNASHVASISVDEGVKAYLGGDLDKAILSFEDALNSGQDAEKIKALLVKALVERSNQLFVQGDFTKAFTYSSRAKELAPNNQEVALINSLILQAKRAVDVRPIRKTETVLIRETSTANRQMQKQIGQLLEAFKQTQQKISLLNVSPTAVSKSVGADIIFYVLLIGVLLAGAIIVFIRVWFRSHESIFTQQQNKLLGVIYNQQQVLLKDNQRLVPESTPTNKESISTREMLSDLNPHVRARGLEVLAEELEREKTPSIVAKKIITPFLSEKDNRVRGNAVKVLYKYDVEQAREILREMFWSGNEWMRLSAAWVIGEVADHEGARWILQAMDEALPHLKRRCIKTIQIFLKNRNPQLPLDLHDQMKETLEKFRDYVEEENSRPNSQSGVLGTTTDSKGGATDDSSSRNISPRWRYVLKNLFRKQWQALEREVRERERIAFKSREDVESLALAEKQRNIRLSTDMEKLERQYFAVKKKLEEAESQFAEYKAENDRVSNLLSQNLAEINELKKIKEDFKKVVEENKNLQNMLMDKSSSWATVVPGGSPILDESKSKADDVQNLVNSYTELEKQWQAILAEKESRVGSLKQKMTETDEKVKKKGEVRKKVSKEKSSSIGRLYYFVNKKLGGLQ